MCLKNKLLFLVVYLCFKHVDFFISTLILVVCKAIAIKIFKKFVNFVKKRLLNINTQTNANPFVWVTLDSTL